MCGEVGQSDGSGEDKKMKLIRKTVPRADIENKGSDDDNDKAA